MERYNLKNRNSSKSKVVIGTAIAVVGLILLLKQLGINYPSWIISWPMILIVIGIANGVKYQFKKPSWFILIAIGVIFLIDEVFTDFAFDQYWPIALIAIGIWFIFGRGYKNNNKKNEDRNDENLQNLPHESISDHQNADSNEFESVSNEYIENVSVFGGTKKNVTSKNFKGGEIVTILGGTEINLSNADINGIVILEVTQIFGGSTIFVPSTWEVRSEMTAIFAGIDDKRSFVNLVTDKSKILIIRGTSIFGGIDIKNF